MRKNLEREIAAAALGSGDGREAVQQLFQQGLTAYRDARLGLRGAGLDDALLRPGRRDYVRIGLPRGASVRLHLAPYDRPRPSGGLVNMPLFTVIRRSVPTRYMDVVPGAKELARRVGTNIDAILRVVLGIERARCKLYELCREETRWL